VSRARFGRRSEGGTGARVPRLANSHFDLFSLSKSAIEPEFWELLGTKKLDDWKLSEAPVEIVGFVAPAGHAGVAAPLRLTRASLGGGEAPVSDGI
jgi:Ubiquitin-like modifier-activating enzyme ATG7 N-terminus